MKRIVVVCFLIFGVFKFMNAQDSVALSIHNLSWEQQYDVAKKLAKSTKKPVLIFFTGSDWCGPCKMLVTDFFETDKFKKIAESEFVLYEADSPRNRNLVTKSQVSDNNILKSKYDVSTFPTIIIVDKNGKLLGKMKGYNLMRDTRYHYAFIESVLKKIKRIR